MSHDFYIGKYMVHLKKKIVTLFIDTQFIVTQFIDFSLISSMF